MNDKMTCENAVSRRAFLRQSTLGAIGALALPNILPERLFAASASPNDQIHVAQIGVGRMGNSDMHSVMRHSLARVVAVCDLDANRSGKAREQVEQHYQKAGGTAAGVKAYKNFHEVLARPDIDAVVVSVPDHWHALVAVEAVLAGKDVYVQKPLTYSILEAQILRQAVQAKGRILQVGSQQRSQNSFRRATELVRNGCLGKIKTVQIGLGVDKPSGKKPAPESVPANLDYETWLGPAPQQAYMEGRVHPQKGLGRPGWITTEDFGLGMITNWGAHHIDIAQWGLGMELSGPLTIDSHAEFMHDDLWTVHTGYHIELTYSNGTKVILDNKNPVGLKFEGDNGWIFCTRGAEKVTESDPNVETDRRGPLRASDPALLRFPIPSNGKRWQPSTNHYLNWLEAVAARKQPIAPVDQAARSVTTCALAWTGMKLKRKLTWDPEQEAFVGDAEANALRFRAPRATAYDIREVAKKGGLTC
jgi:myo-inositol 2-dehydrogenase / D-chiro-inositol 1-dehydrogenase